MEQEYLLELLKEIHPVETRLQILKNQLVGLEKSLALYKKANVLEDGDIDGLDNLYKKISEHDKKMEEYLAAMKKIDEDINNIGYIEELNTENYYNLLDWTKEIEKRESDEVEQIYKMKYSEIKRQGNFVKIFAIIRNISILLALLFLILRNYIAYDFTESLSTNFSILGVTLLIVVWMANYVYKKNKKIFEDIDINYKNNQNVIRLLKISVEDMLKKCFCNSVEEFSEKIEENTKKFEKTYQINEQKQGLRERINNAGELRKMLHSKFFTTVSALNVRYDKENVDKTISLTRANYAQYKGFMEEYSEQMNEFSILWEEYKHKSKLCEKLWLEAFYQ